MNNLNYHVTNLNCVHYTLLNIVEHTHTLVNCINIGLVLSNVRALLALQQFMHNSTWLITVIVIWHPSKLTTVIRDAAKHQPLCISLVRRSQSAEPAIHSTDNMMSAMEKTKIGCTLGLRTCLLYMAEIIIDAAPRKLHTKCSSW